MTPEAIEKSKATRFKKGDRPANEMQVGAVVVSSDGYKLRKKQMTGSLWERWEFLHRAVWVENNGPIPDGMMVSFRDSNPLNCDIENLMLITKSENAKINRRGLRFEDPDLTDAAVSMVRLENAVRERRNDIENLMLITKSENAKINRRGLRFEDPDLTDAAVSMVRLENAVRERRKKKK